MAKAPVIMWFREDFRLSDNLALREAQRSGQPVLCIVILDEAHLPGAAARWWLHGAIDALDADLRRMGGALHVFRGVTRDILPIIVKLCGATGVFWNRRYDPAGIETDSALKTRLQQDGIEARSFAGALLHEPWQVRNQSGAPYKIFTAFWRAARTIPLNHESCPAPEKLEFAAPPAEVAAIVVKSCNFGLLPKHPDWAGGLRDSWTAGEDEALTQFSSFLRHDQARYETTRDFPTQDRTSRLSAYLRFGNISPARIWHAANAGQCAEKFLAELGWRDFAWSLLFASPDLATRNLRPEFDAMPWRHDPAGLLAWQRGMTGYPMVDAGMRELWHTGWMHNRVRMVCASFLVKHLLIDWREGERWFADTLVDHDPASNPMNWQWSAGTGVDAAPYFRIMNPILQSEKFDPAGEYIRQWLPELAHLPDALIHTPWKSDMAKNYPDPIVEHQMARARALAAWKML